MIIFIFFKVGGTVRSRLVHGVLSSGSYAVFGKG